MVSKIPYSFVYIIERLSKGIFQMSNSSREQLYRLDEKAVEELVERYRIPLLYFITGFLGELTDAEDVVSETIVKLLVKKPLLRSEKALKTYLYATAKHFAVDRLRKRKREKQYLENATWLAKTDIAYIDETLCDTEDKRQLAKALRSLSPEYRQVLHLSYFEDLSTPEICKILGKNKKQIYNLLARARAALAEIIEKEDSQNEI